MSAPRAVIFGCAGLEPTREERDFFAASDPLGFILFARNVRAPAQVRALVAALREAVGRADAPVLIDQEGGRVARLRPPHWRAGPAAARFGELARGSLDRARDACRLNARLIADDLSSLGITVACAPVLDLRAPGASDVIGDRAFAAEPALIIALGRAMAEGLIEGGVIPVIKHIPGHGRANADSHAELPVVGAPRAVLEAEDFAPFRALHDLPWAMTGHVLYEAVDPQRAATVSPIVIADVIRGTIGFDGLLASDDLSMQALAGSLPERARDALAAGCDVALHCNGDLPEMTAIADACGPLSARSFDRLARGQAAVARRATAFDRPGALSRLAELLPAA